MKKMMRLRPIRMTAIVSVGSLSRPPFCVTSCCVEPKLGHKAIVSDVVYRNMKHFMKARLTIADYGRFGLNNGVPRDLRKK